MARQIRTGDIVVCTGSRGYHLTTGKRYRVLAYLPEEHSEHFTWPEYVNVTDDYGKVVGCHAHRFKLPDKPRAIWSPFMQAWTWPWGLLRPSKEYIAFIAELNRRNVK
ncbi:hypothetical protein [Stenotrophomonas phage TS-10]|uniref:Uncharacterized protein n=1 Tax=Stenotrophomonas phage TS-10 TaxID=2886106 RepID=A0AAE9C4C7_9CAUD|nr:hypothetical protein [Stenotrophomonas phage TS-10]